MTLHSIITSLWSILWMFIQMHSLRICYATLFACIFFKFSGPVGWPQNPSLLLCECFWRARAPTDSFETFLILRASSTLKIWFGLLKFASNSYPDGQIMSYDPIVFLKPSIVKTPRIPIYKRNDLMSYSACFIYRTSRASKICLTMEVPISDRVIRYSKVSSLTDYPMKRGSNLMGKFPFEFHKFRTIATCFSTSMVLVFPKIPGKPENTYSFYSPLFILVRLTCCPQISGPNAESLVSGFLWRLSTNSTNCSVITFMRSGSRA